MTKTKLEIIGPYTPEHGGPFCTRDGKPVRIICTDRKSCKNNPIVALVNDGDQELNYGFDIHGNYCCGDRSFDLMNAREVPVAREFWVNEYHGGGRSVYLSKEESEKYKVCLQRTIHVREVLPRDGE